MTYRERREARAARLREWADKREAKAAAAFGRADQISERFAGGQPILVGHHSEKGARADQGRIFDAMGRGVEHTKKAAAMHSRADNIEAAAERAIYSDDDDAIGKLDARIAELEQQRARMVAINKQLRAGAMLDDLDLTDAERRTLESVARYQSYAVKGSKSGYLFPAYALSNLGGNISKQKARRAALAAELNPEPAPAYPADPEHNPLAVPIGELRIGATHHDSRSGNVLTLDGIRAVPGRAGRLRLSWSGSCGFFYTGDEAAPFPIITNGPES